MAGHFRKHFRRRFGARGASLVEYALLLVAVLLLAAGGFKLLGGSVAKRSAAASDTVTANGASGAGGSGSGGPGNGGSAGTAGARGHGPAGAESSSGRQADVAEGFAGKKWFAVGLLATGIGALGYVVFAMRKAKADAQS